MPDRAWMLTLMLAAAGCATEEQCQDRLEVARAQALEDTPSCGWDPDAVDPQDCLRFDERPRRAYIGAFCSTATLACLESEAEIEEACFGRPEDL